MKVLVFTLLLSSKLFATEIIVNVNGLRTTEGNIQVAVWKSAEGFPGDYTKSWTQKTILATQTRVIFEEATSGYYAIAVFHDKNSDNDLNRNAVGIPTEGFGFSNNPRIIFGPPNFKKAKFEVRENEISEIEIELKHF